MYSAARDSPTLGVSRPSMDGSASSFRSADSSASVMVAKAAAGAGGAAGVSPATASGASSSATSGGSVRLTAAFSPASARRGRAQRHPRPDTGDGRQFRLKSLEGRPETGLRLVGAPSRATDAGDR